MIIGNEKNYVIMTKDKKCIVKGSKNTKLVLTTLDEKCNLMLYTCRQKKIVCNNLNAGYRNLTLTDNVRDLYKTKNKYYSDSGLPELIAVKIKTTYEVEDE